MLLTQKIARQHALGNSAKVQLLKRQRSASHSTLPASGGFPHSPVAPQGYSNDPYKALGIPRPAAPSAPQAPTPQNTPLPPSSAPASSNDPFAISPYTSTNGAPDPRDAQYWENVNKLRFQAQTQYAQSNADQANSDIEYGAMKQQASTDRQRSERSLAEQMIRSGLTNSGYNDRSQAEATQDFVTKMGGAERQKLQQDAARAAAQQAIIAGFSIDQAAELAEAAARYADRQAQEAQNSPGDLTADDIAAMFADGGDGGGSGGGGGGGRQRGAPNRRNARGKLKKGPNSATVHGGMSAAPGRSNKRKKK